MTGAVVAADLQQRAQLLGEQRAHDAVAEAAARQFGLPLQPVGVVHQRVVAQRVEVERDAAVAGEGHLAQAAAKRPPSERSW
jgi:hypothetical protein